MSSEFYDGSDAGYTADIGDELDSYGGDIEDSLLLTNDEVGGFIQDDEDFVDEQVAAGKDADWEVDMSVAAATSPDDGLVPVPVPSSAELDVRGLLDAADAPTRVAHYRTQLAEIIPRLAKRPNPADTPEFGTCELEHESLQHEATAVVDGLVEVMVPIKKDTPAGAHYTSSHSGCFLMEDGTLVPAVRWVGVYKDETGLYDTPISKAISVITNHAPPHTWRSSPLTYEERGVVSADSATAFKSLDISSDQVGVDSLHHVARDIAEEIRQGSFEDAIQPWLASYMALPHPTTPPPPTEQYGMAYMAKPIFDFLAGGEQDVQQATETLRALLVYDGADEHLAETFKDFLDGIRGSADVTTICERMDAYGITERYAWLLQHAEAMHADVVAGERAALHDQFRDRYRQWYDAKHAVLERIQSLAHELERMPSWGRILQRKLDKSKPALPVPPAAEPAPQDVLPVPRQTGRWWRR